MMFQSCPGRTKHPIVSQCMIGMSKLLQMDVPKLQTSKLRDKKESEQKKIALAVEYLKQLVQLPHCVDRIQGTNRPTQCSCLHTTFGNDMQSAWFEEFAHKVVKRHNSSRKSRAAKAGWDIRNAETTRLRLKDAHEDPEKCYLVWRTSDYERVCKNALMALYGEGKDRWQTYTKKYNLGHRDLPHGLSGRASNASMKAETRDSLNEFFRETAKLGVPRRYGKVAVIQLPSSMTKRSLYARWCKGRSPAETGTADVNDIISFTTFISFWNKNYKQLVIARKGPTPAYHFRQKWHKLGLYKTTWESGKWETEYLVPPALKNGSVDAHHV